MVEHSRATEAHEWASVGHSRATVAAASSLLSVRHIESIVIFVRAIYSHLLSHIEFKGVHWFFRCNSSPPKATEKHLHEL
jgi:hypothetical protein